VAVEAAVALRLAGTVAVSVAVTRQRAVGADVAEVTATHVRLGAAAVLTALTAHRLTPTAKHTVTHGRLGLGSLSNGRTRNP